MLPKKIAIETWAEELKLIASNNYESEIRQNKNINWTFLHVQFINTPMSGTKSLILPSDKYLKNISTSIQTLIEFSNV